MFLQYLNLRRHLKICVINVSRNKESAFYLYFSPIFVRYLRFDVFTSALRVQVIFSAMFPLSLLRHQCIHPVLPGERGRWSFFLQLACKKRSSYSFMFPHQRLESQISKTATHSATKLNPYIDPYPTMCSARFGVDPDYHSGSRAKSRFSDFPHYLQNLSSDL